MLIEYKNVLVCQKDGIPVLRDVNFHVGDGEFVYVIGKVGSGKSTLLKTIYAEIFIDEGEEAMVLGNNMLSLRLRNIPSLRRQMGVVFQDFQLLADRSVLKNLEFVLKATGWKKKEEIQERIAKVLTDVGMLDKKDKKPHELSGGERQRVAIARAILNSPQLIVADEPTANLDPETADGIMQLLRQISQTGTAVLMTTHNMPLLEKYPGIVYRCHNEHLEDVTNNYNKILIEEDDNWK
jgi:cell division transport system ATP-binding protein